MKRLFSRITLSLAVIASICLPAAPALAANNPFLGVDCTTASDSAVCQATHENPLVGNDGILHKVTVLLAVIAAITAVIIIIISGIRFITSAGNPAEISKARNSIIFATVGLIIIVLAQTIITFVLNRI